VRTIAAVAIMLAKTVGALPALVRLRLGYAVLLLAFLSQVSTLRLTIAGQWLLNALWTVPGLLGVAAGVTIAGLGIVAMHFSRHWYLAEIAAIVGFLVASGLLDKVEQVVAPPILPVMYVTADGNHALALDLGGYLVRLEADGVVAIDPRTDAAIYGRMLRFERSEDRGLVEEAISARPFVLGWSWFHPHRHAAGFAAARQSYAVVHWRRLRINAPSRSGH
jgi:hypothetical protein